MIETTNTPTMESCLAAHDVPAATPKRLARKTALVTPVEHPRPALALRELALADSRSNIACFGLWMFVGCMHRRDSNAVFVRAVSAGARWR
jgi:hypothetical protein